jgi:RNA recognition motif-containing protein
MSTEGRKLYVGNLNDSATKEDVETYFSRFGKVATSWIARNPTGFAFVTYEDEQDALAAVRAVNGEEFQGKA